MDPRTHAVTVAAQLADTYSIACGEPSGHAPSWMHRTVCASARARVESCRQHPLYSTTRKLSRGQPSIPCLRSSVGGLGQPDGANRIRKILPLEHVQLLGTGLQQGCP